VPSDAGSWLPPHLTSSVCSELPVGAADETVAGGFILAFVLFAGAALMERSRPTNAPPRSHLRLATLQLRTRTALADDNGILSRLPVRVAPNRRP